MGLRSTECLNASGLAALWVELGMLVYAVQVYAVHRLLQNHKTELARCMDIDWLVKAPAWGCVDLTLLRKCPNVWCAMACVVIGSNVGRLGTSRAAYVVYLIYTLYLNVDFKCFISLLYSYIVFVHCIHIMYNSYIVFIWCIQILYSYGAFICCILELYYILFPIHIFMYCFGSMTIFIQGQHKCDFTLVEICFNLSDPSASCPMPAPG